MKRIHKFIAVVFSMLILFTAVGLTGCIGDPNGGRDFEVDGWQLFQFNRSNRVWSRQVFIRGANDDLAVDGVLTIPARIGGHEISGFGGWAPAWNPGFYTVKVVVPTEIPINWVFWAMVSTRGSPGNWENRQPRYVELLCNTFENVDFSGAHSLSQGYDGTWFSREFAKTIIIPNNSSQNLITQLEIQNIEVKRYNFIEKSQFGGIN